MNSTKKNNPWLRHLELFYVNHPYMSLKQAMKEASKSYKTIGGGSGKKRKQNSDIEVEKKGDCYPSAYNFMIENHGKIANLRVAHGYVSGKGELSGKRFDHAWCEDENFVYDYSNYREIKMPKILYYTIGNIYPEDVKYYTYEQTKEMVKNCKHFGPFEIESKVYKEEYDPKRRRYF